MSLTIWCYSGCGTCKKAINWLKDAGLTYDVKAIRDEPPAADLIAAMLTRYEGKRAKILNTSGGDYRQEKDALASLSDEELVQRLSENGNLLKRPFVTRDGAAWGSGFKPADWEPLLSAN